MKLSDAIELISHAFDKMDVPAIWMDLGCGTGLFTYAMCSLLNPGSTVIAIDKEEQDFESSRNGVGIQFMKMDFSQGDLPVLQTEGILMANSLHYVQNKEGMIRKLKDCLKPHGQLVIIEYDRSDANAWVPYPLRYSELQNLLNREGFLQVKKIGEKPSAYGDFNMYACSAIVSFK